MTKSNMKSFSKDEYDKSEDSDKEIMVINRMLKSKIFLQSNNNNNNNYINKKIIKRSTNIYNTKENFDKNKQNANKLKKSLNFQSKKIENEFHENLSLKDKQNCIKKLEKINIKKKKETENKDLNKNENKFKGNEKSENDKCDKLNSFKEMESISKINDNCINHNNAKNCITNKSFEKTNDKIIDQQNNCNNNEKGVNKNLYKIDENNNFNNSYSYDKIVEGLGYDYKKKKEENNIESTSYINIKQNNDYCIEENIEEKDYYLNKNYIYESSKCIYLQKKNNNIIINEDNSSVIKYDEFELEEINNELERIIEEENYIQEQILHLTDKELELAIKIKKSQHSKKLLEKENTKKECEEYIE
ncbi:conserved Plasmodium protein, unknown function [Plasmodium gallinaceum]|uniref:Uncharacterized protein n=1 Tax=Plasmodium gallinaceum TaxID=5849 RepID=A0A1J1GV79_PLAGA|nr:conserved Plasmodium protein, unknown function [Plasmodium gallinaceum]CRG96196.1 conserved Plasmodium protein, unknown function [Plasmodium gallinaceum]